MFKLHPARLQKLQKKLYSGGKLLVSCIRLLWNSLFLATASISTFIIQLTKQHVLNVGRVKIDNLKPSRVVTRTFRPFVLVALISLSSVVFAGTIITFESAQCNPNPCTYNISTITTSYNLKPSIFVSPSIPWYLGGSIAQILSEKISNTYVAYVHDQNGVWYFYNGNWTGSPFVSDSAVLPWAYVMQGPDPVDTQGSIQALSKSIRSFFSSQTVATNFANMNTYDCDVFDRKGMCISVGAQNTNVDGLSHAMTAGIVVGGYQFSSNFRVGAFLNQTRDYDISTSIQTSHISPLFGAFAVWNENANHSGYQIKIATAFQSMDAILTRPVIGSSEAGSGKTNFSTQSYIGELSYAYVLNDGATIARPYTALRYTRIRQAGYTEFSDISSPLTFNAVEDRSLSALMGMKLEHTLSNELTLTGSFGFEHDVSHHTDRVIASGVSDLAGEPLYGKSRKTRAVASVGAQYKPARNHVISADISYQQLPYDHKDTTVAYIRYTVGF